MIFWAVLGFGLFLLCAAFAIPRLAFAVTLLVLLTKTGWLDFFDAAGAENGFAVALTFIFVAVACLGGFALDIHDHSNR